MALKLKVYDDFSKGEYGSLGGRDAGKLAEGWFTAKNMRRLRSGFMCPRPGIKNLGLTGIPAGTLWGLGWNGTPGFSVWFVISTGVNNGVYASDGTAGDAISLVGNLTAAPTDYVTGKETITSHTHLTVPGNQSYKINHATSVLTALAGSTGGADIEMYGDRMLIATYGSNRIRYSEALNFDSWPTENFFDVGGRATVTGLFAQRGHLSIMTRSNEFYVLTGVPGVNASLRRAAGTNTHPWSLYSRHAVLLGTDQILFMPTSADYPAMFNGLSITEMRHLGLQGGVDGGYSSYASNTKVSRSFRADDALVLMGNRVAEKYNDAWVFHTLENGLSLIPVSGSENQGRVYLASNPAGTPVIHTYQAALERPAFTSDTYAQPGDNSNTPLDASLTMPEEWFDAEGTVKQVTVDFIKYNTGAAATNHFDVELTVFGRGENSSETTHTNLSFDEAGSSASTSGISVRKTFTIGRAGSGAGFQVALKAIRGVVIKSITVATEVKPLRFA